MNQEIKQKWLAALRSGEYKQGRGCLKRDNRYCCLGVLCDLYAKEKGLEWEGSTIIPSESSYYLPRTVSIWAGIENGVDNWNGNPVVEYRKSEKSLAALNDDKLDFNKIADVIEKSL